jgi:diguanylate cyclase (GGDEF)-like protein
MTAIPATAQPREWRFSSRVMLPIVLAFLAMSALVAGFLVYAVHEADRTMWERQSRIVSHVLDEQFAKITHDQESVTIWDETLMRVHAEPLDFDWLDHNLGIWLYEYFGHDRAYVLNGEDQPIYGMAGGERAPPSSFTTARSAVTPLIRSVRETIAAAAADPEAGAGSISNLVMIEARPALASVAQIVSDTGESLAPGEPFLHVSLRFLDGSFLERLMQQYLLKNARFAWNRELGAAEAALPLKRNSGAVLGYLVWEPERPGQSVLIRTGPVLAAALLLVGFIISLLVRRLRRASQELQTSEAQAQHLAFHDPLTGLANRTLFNDRLDRALAEVRRDGSRLALLCLDLDRFKHVNDTLGHPAGDDLIRELSQRLIGLIRGSDCVARLGGDEFAIVQTDVGPDADVTALCDRIIHAVSQPFRLLGSSAFVGVSIGVAVAPQGGVDRAELMRKADIALYAAKSTGRNRFRTFTEDMDVSVQRRREIETELREAIASGDQFCIHYQPLYSADGQMAITGIEALLRWKHPRHGLIPPGTFVAIAEETGLIHPIGDWVMREACLAAQRWPIQRLAVNVSAVQFRSAGFAAKVLGLVDAIGMKPGRLELEITEGVLLDTTELSATTLTTLRAAGVRIALDDFGTGYSSLTYLQKYPVDKIKIDRSFIQNLDSDAASNALVQAMVDLARAMGVEVTAEGVETAAQREFLTRIGCNELQGYLLSHPVEARVIDAIFGVDVAAEIPVADAA